MKAKLISRIVSAPGWGIDVTAGIFDMLQQMALGILGHRGAHINTQPPKGDGILRNGPAFYGLPVNTETITLIKGEVVRFPKKIASEDGPITVFDPGVDIHWQVKE